MSGTNVLDRLQQFRALAIAAREAAEEGSSSELDRILEDRRLLARELGRAPRPDSQREREARSAVLKGILDIDHGTEDILRQQRDEVGAELVAMDSGRRGLVGYGAGGRSAGKRIDERG